MVRTALTVIIKDYREMLMKYFWTYFKSKLDYLNT